MGPGCPKVRLWLDFREDISYLVRWGTVWPRQRSVVSGWHPKFNRDLLFQRFICGKKNLKIW